MSIESDEKVAAEIGKLMTSAAPEDQPEEGIKKTDWFDIPQTPIKFCFLLVDESNPLKLDKGSYIRTNLTREGYESVDYDEFNMMISEAAMMKIFPDPQTFQEIAEHLTIRSVGDINNCVCYQITT